LHLYSQIAVVPFLRIIKKGLSVIFKVQVSDLSGHGVAANA
jgi:hypothetical protein